MQTPSSSSEKKMNARSLNALHHDLENNNLLQGISHGATLLTVESENDLMAALSLEEMEEHEPSKISELRRARLLKQVEELAAQYHYSKLVSMFGVKLPEGQQGTEEWVYPMLAYALKQLFQTKGVHLLFSDWDADHQARLVTRGSTSLSPRQHALSTSAFPAISPENYERCPLTYWMEIGHYSPKVVSLEKGTLFLGHPQVNSVQAEAALIIKLQLNRSQGDGLLVVTDTLERLKNPVLQTMLYKSALVLASVERLNIRSQHMHRFMNSDLSHPIGMATLGDWQRYRNEFLQEVNIYSDLQQQFMLALNDVINQRMGVTEGSIHLATHYIIQLSNQLELNEKTKDSLVKATLFMQLHKIHVREDQLKKQSTWDSEDFSAYYSSIETSFKLLSHLYSLGDTLPYLHYMFERWDGNGRPNRLKGRNIPLGSRMLGLVYALSAMLEPKPYRTDAFTPKQALELLHKESAQRWDPMLLEALGHVVDQEATPPTLA
jgi:HD-GYP domain-containing protein (c-di-GMP phosphodiesterase class II)